MHFIYFYLFLLIYIPLGFSRDTIARLPHHIISLYTPEIFRYHRTIEKLKKACDKITIATDKIACNQAMPPAKVWRTKVFERPSFDSEELGEVGIHVSPTKGLHFSYKAKASKNEYNFTPDISCKFLNSDCVAEHTVLDRIGDWIQLPQDPFSQPPWWNFKHRFRMEPRVRPLLIEGRSYIIGRSVRATRATNGKNQFLHSGEEIYIKKLTKSEAIVRRAQPGDDSCKPKKFTTEEEPPEYMIMYPEFYNGKGQLRVNPAYPDYCLEKETISAKD